MALDVRAHRAGLQVLAAGAAETRVASAGLHVLTGQQHLTEQQWRAAYAFRPNSEAYAQAVLADNPTHYFQLEESTGSVATDQAGLQNGTYVNSPDLGIVGAVPGKKATSFSASSSQYVEVPRSQPNLTALTFEAWLRTTASGGILMSSRRDFGGFTLGWGDALAWGTTAGRPGFCLDGNGFVKGKTATSARIDDGVWHHLVGTWSTGSGSQVVPGHFDLYIDGSLVVATTNNLDYSTAYSPQGGGYYRIASRYNGSMYSNVDVDEVAIYEGVRLSPSRVAAHFDAA